MVNAHFQHVIILLFLSLNCLVHAEDGPQRDFEYRYFNQSTGFLEEPGQIDYQDELQCLWFTGKNGIYRFNGTIFEEMLTIDEIRNDIPQLDETLNLNIIGNAGDGALWIKPYSSQIQTLVKYISTTHAVSTFHTKAVINRPLWINDSICWTNGWYQKELGHFLTLYNAKSDSILQSYEVPTRDEKQYNAINRILLDEEANGLWMASDVGLMHFDISSHEFKIYGPEEIPPEWTIRYCNDIVLDDDGTIWLDYAFGPYLFSFDPNNKTFESVYKKIDYVFDDITQIVDFGDSLWLVDGLDELLLLNKKNYEIKKILNRNDPLHYIGNIYNIFIDEQKNTWISGTKGILRISTKPIIFKTLHIPKFNAQFKKQNHSRNIELTSNNQFWIASQESLLHYDFEKQEFSEDLAHWDKGCGWKNTTTDTLPGEEINAITAVAEDRKKNLWISGYRCLQSINTLTGERKTIQPFKQKKSTSAYPIFRSLTFDSLNFIWGGGMDLGIGRIDPETGEEFLIDMKGPWGEKYGLAYIYKILFTPQGKLIFHCRDKILSLKVIKDLDPYNAQIEDYELESLISNDEFRHASQLRDSVWRITTFCLDNSGDIWLIANHHLFQFLPATGKLIFHQKMDDAMKMGANKPISDIHGRVWFFSNKSGIYAYDPSDREVYHFTKADGVPWYSFIYGHNIKRAADGRIYVWTMEGIFNFNPDELIHSIQNNAKIICTHLQINNENIYPGPNSPINSDFRLLPDLNLNHSHKSFSFRYSVLDNSSNPGDYIYRYILEGFDDDWINAKTRTYLGYSNLAPGDYLLRINASKNQAFNDDNEISIHIHIKRAPWLSWWAFTGYAIIFIGVISTIISLYISKERQSKITMLEHNELSKTKEIETAKTNFFTNISHELRTPLTLIIEPLKNLIKGINPREQMALYHLMLKNARKLQALIDQILDVSKIEAQVMTLNAERTEISSFTKQISSHFNSMAITRNIHFDFQSPIEPLYAWVDRDKYEKILNNLLGNAFKFTPKGGSIYVKVDTSLSENTDETNDWFTLVVEDTGLGVPKNKIDSIFDRFYQVEEGHSEGVAGSGIGLFIVREYVNLHRGRIDIDSQPGIGTKFILNFPIDQYHENETTTPDEQLIEEEINAPAASTYLTSKPAGTFKNKRLVLLVDDHPDMLAFIKYKLQDHFEIIAAPNGVDAIEEATEHLPDLIISDVMMSGIDGFEFCKRIKEDQRTCHIPIILLTARADKDSRIEGLEIGADDYLTKPFDIDILISRSKNIMLQREKLSQIFKKELLLKDKMKQLTDKDQQLINQLMEVIENTIDDPNLSVNKLCTKVGLSRAQFYRKLLAITNQKPTEFIRTIRLKKAAELLVNNFGTISEVAYSVGFSNLSYFSESFKKEYGISPHKYRNKYHKV